LTENDFILATSYVYKNNENWSTRQYILSL
jgi:hypothetical protein